MKQVVIAHALGVTSEFTWGISPGFLWYPAAKEALTKKGYAVKIPAFPNANHPQREPWINVLHTAVDSDPASTVLVGHSVGGITVLRYLESLDLEEPFRRPFSLRQMSLMLAMKKLQQNFLRQHLIMNVSRKT